MSRYACIALLLALPWAAPVSADDWQKTYRVTDVPAVSIDADDAAVQVRSWDRNEVSVRIVSDRAISLDSGGGGLRVTEHQSGNAISIGLRERRSMFRVRLRWRETRVEVRVPRHARLDIRTADGPCNVSGVDGDIAIESGDGSIRAEDLTGHMRLETSDGAIRASGVRGDVMARSGDGRIEIYGTFSRLELHTADGPIIAGAGPESAPAEEGWRIRTGDGSITLRIAGNLAASLDAHTNDGRVHIHFEDVVKGEIERQLVRVDLNGGGPAITMRSGDGSIRIERY